MAKKTRIIPRILQLLLCCLIFTGWTFAQEQQEETPVLPHLLIEGAGKSDVKGGDLERINELSFMAPFSQGHVFAAVSNGRVQHYDANGNLLETLNTGLGGFTTGMATDSDGNLYVTNFSGNSVSVFDGPALPHTHSVFSNAGLSSSPESILFDQAGDVYVGHASGLGDIVKLNNAGSEIDRFNVTVGPRGSDWIDLSADQTVMYYTSEGSAIYRYDLVNDTQLAPFTTTLPGGSAFALRLLPGGGILVANSTQIHRLDDSGTIVQSYDVVGEDRWFALNLDPDGTSFWSGDFGTANFYKIDIASGNILLGPINTGTGGNTLFGLTVFGEIAVGQNNPPVCEVSPAGPFTVQEGSLLTFDVTGTDIDINDVLTIDATDIPANATTDPSLPTNGASGLTTTFEWTPQPGQNGSYTVNFSVTDASGESSTCPVEIIVEEAPSTNEPPVCSITPTDTYTVNEGDPISFSVTGNDTDPGAAVTISVSGLPSGATMTPSLPVTGPDGVSSSFDWTPADGQDGTYEVVYTLTDENNAQTTCSVNITVQDANPQTDTTDPLCEIIGVDPGPPVVLSVMLQDTESGISHVNILRDKNAEVVIPSFTPGTNDAIMVTATKINPEKGSSVVLEVFDMAGNSTICDPVYTTLSSIAPEDFQLEQNYPNPFNPTTTIRFGLADAQTFVSLKVYDVSGREVRTLINENISAGQYSVEWDGKDNNGREVSGGIYLYRLTAGSFVQTRKMTFLK